MASDDDHLARDLAVVAGQRLVDLRARGGTPDELRHAGDRLAHDFLATELARLRPGDAVLSEEGADDPARLGADRVWIIDPLDGTREFGEGRGRLGRPRGPVGADRRGLAAGAVALRPRATCWAPASRRPCRRPAGPPFRHRGQPHPPAAVRAALAEALGAELVPMGSAGAKVAAVLRGEVDAYVHAGGQYEWDSAAPVAVARAAGLPRSPGSTAAQLVYNQARPALPDILVCPPRSLTSAAAGRDPSPLNPSSTSSARRPVMRTRLPRCPSSTAGGRVDPHHPRGRGRVRAAGAAVLRRQGLDRHAAAGREGVLARPRSRSRSCTSTPGTTSPRCWSSATSRVAELGVRLIVASVQDAIDARPGRRGDRPDGSRNRLQTGHAARRDRGAPASTRCFGGARRDEEKARAKERVFSFRDDFGQWDPKNQRPELWNLYNGRHPPRRAHPGLPAVELDRARHLALHRAGEHRDARRSTTPTSARSSSATACCSPVNEFMPAAGRRGAVRRRRCATAPSATRRCTGAVESDARHRREGHRRGRGHPDHRARRDPRPTTGSARPPWKTASGRATSDADASMLAVRHRGLGRRRQVAP